MGIKLKEIVFLLLAILGIMLLYIIVNRYVGIRRSDIIVRVEFTGLENLFHAKNEYYAINSKRSYRISRSFVIKHFGEDAVRADIYQDEFKDNDTFAWFARLNDSKVNWNFNEDKPFLKTSLGNQYRIYYEPESHNKPLTIENQKIMRLVSETLFLKEMPKMEYPQKPASYAVLSFMLIQHGSQYLVDYEQSDYLYLYRLNEDGNLTRVMKMPSNGTFASYYFCSYK